jgi:hypothetical protein
LKKKKREREREREQKIFGSGWQRNEQNKKNKSLHQVEGNEKKKRRCWCRKKTKNV